LIAQNARNQAMMYLLWLKYLILTFEAQWCISK